jgi:hypothetical protein
MAGEMWRYWKLASRFKKGLFEIGAAEEIGALF